MQGAARMVMQTGMHPAAIKDSVTSTSLPFPLSSSHRRDLTPSPQLPEDVQSLVY